MNTHRQSPLSSCNVAGFVYTLHGSAKPIIRGPAREPQRQMASNATCRWKRDTKRKYKADRVRDGNILEVPWWDPWNSRIHSTKYETMHTGVTPLKGVISHPAIHPCRNSGEVWIGFRHLLSWAVQIIKNTKRVKGYYLLNMQPTLLLQRKEQRRCRSITFCSHI